MRFYDKYEKSINGGCAECGGICGGAGNPKELLETVLQHVENGNMTGGEFAKVINEYSRKGINGAGFFGDLWSGIKKGFSTVASIAKPILSFIPHPAAQMASRALGATGFGRRRRAGRPRK